MRERESVARELEDSSYEINQARGGKVLEITRSNMAEIIDFPEPLMLETVTKKIKKNQGLKKLVASTIIGLTAATGATIFSGVTAKNDHHTAIESQEDEEGLPHMVKINPNMDNIVTVGTTGVAPPVEITTPETESELESEPDDDFEFASSTPKQNTKQTVTDISSETTTPQPHEVTSPSQISSGLDIAIRTAFSEGAYNSEEDARKIADVIINRAVKNGTSIGAEVSNGEFEAYDRGVEGRGNWGWREYGSGPQNGSIGTERVQQIFVEELNKAIQGQPLAYDYTGFGATGDGRTNKFH